MLLLNANGVELSFTLRFSEAFAAPFKEQANREYEDLQEQIKEEARTLPQAQKLVALTRQVLRVIEQIESTKGRLAAVDEDVTSALADGAADVADFAKEQGELRQQLGLLEATLPKLRSELDSRKEVFRRAASDLACGLRIAVQQTAQSQEQSLGGILKDSAERFGEMIVAEANLGNTRASVLDELLAGRLVQELSPPLPTPAPGGTPGRDPYASPEGALAYQRITHV
jgi:hypothetical protein